MTGLNIEDLPSFANFEADLKKIYVNVESKIYDMIVM